MITTAVVIRTSATVLLVGTFFCACNKETSASSVCERYISCLEAVVAGSFAPPAAGYQQALDQARGAYGPNGTCNESAEQRGQCDQACQAGLTAAHDAFAGVQECGGSAANDAGAADHPELSDGAGVGDSCKKYLACLSVAQPSAYAAALVIYGQNAACWDTPDQASTCNKVCETEFSKISSACSCSGSTCVAAKGCVKFLECVSSCPGEDFTCPNQCLSNICPGSGSVAAKYMNCVDKSCSCYGAWNEPACQTCATTFCAQQYNACQSSTC